MKSLLFPRFCRTAAAVLTFAVALGTAALPGEEPQHPLKPFLWKIEGAGLEKPSYLFGTIHLGSGPLANLHPAAAAAFDSAEVVYTEVALDPKTQLELMGRLIRDDGRTLTASIGTKLAKELDEELKLINPAIGAEAFETLKTWAIAMALPLLPSQMKGEIAMDQMLWQRAVEAEKETGGIERPEDQTEIFDDLTEQEQVITLSEIIGQLRKDRAAERDAVADLVSAYVSGDVEALQREVEKSLKEIAESEHKELGERLMKRLLADRDVTMAASIAKSLEGSPAKTHFFAAGAGHFAGKTSIRSHLADQGYQITPVTD